MVLRRIQSKAAATMSKLALMIEVNAGLILSEPLMEHRKRWTLTGEEAQNPERWRRAHGEALMYMMELQNPRKVNWVHLDWIWL